MAQAIENPEQISTASGATDTFATIFTFENAADVQVLVDAGEGFEVQEQGVAYVLAAGDWLNDGADVVFQAGFVPAATHRVLRRRRTALQQLDRFGDLERFRPEASEAAYDRLTRMNQDQAAQLERAVTVPPGEVPPSPAQIAAAAMAAEVAAAADVKASQATAVAAAAVGAAGAAVVDAAAALNGLNATNADLVLVGATADNAAFDAAAADVKAAAALAAVAGKASQAGVDAAVAGLLKTVRASRIISAFEFMSDAEIDDATSGQYPTMDVAPKLQAWLDFLGTDGYTGRIPKAQYLLGTALYSLGNVSIESEAAAKLHFSDLSDWGWVVNGFGLGGNQYCNVILPCIIGPNDILRYYTDKGFDYDSFTGVALEVRNCIWGHFEYQNCIAAGEGIRFCAPNSVCDNLTYKLGTTDLTTIGIHFYSPANAAAPVGQIRGTTLNNFSYQGVKWTGYGPGVFECHVDSLGIYNGQEGGIALFFDGPINTACSFHGKIENRRTPNDSPAGTPENYHGRLVGGTATVLGQTGWAVPTRFRCEITTTFPDEYQPGSPIAIRMAGPGSFVKLLAPESEQTGGAITLSTVQGEANFNGGVGAAPITRYMLVVVNVSALAAGAARMHYAYHQCLNPTNVNPVKVAAHLNPLSGVELQVSNNGAVVPREIKVNVINNRATSFTGSINFWLEID